MQSPGFDSILHVARWTTRPTCIGIPLFFGVTLAVVTVVPSLFALDEHMHCLLKLAYLDVLQHVC